MSVRWYSVVVDCRDFVAQADWWAEVLGWPVVYRDDDEAEIAASADQDAYARTQPRPPSLTFVPVPEGKTVKNRLHIDLAPRAEDDQAAEVERLLELGATRVDIGQGEQSWVVLADPEGNEFCVLSARD